VAQPITSLSQIPGFDPRLAPVIGRDLDLPCASPEVLAPDALRQRFSVPPLWQPELRAEPLFTDRAPRSAAVLVPIITHDRPTVLLTQRTQQLRNHSGQVAFPGGKVDPEDVDIVAAALREAEEEIGLSRAFVQVLGTLPVYTTGTAFMVTPVVALVQPGFTLTLNPEEVASAFEVPLDFLMNPANHQRHQVQFGELNREWFSMPFQDGPSERFIWGATAGLLRNLYRFVTA